MLQAAEKQQLVRQWVELDFLEDHKIGELVDMPKYGATVENFKLEYQKTCL